MGLREAEPRQGGPEWHRGALRSTFALRATHFKGTGVKH
jgi:hypothetical protein